MVRTAPLRTDPDLNRMTTLAEWMRSGEYENVIRTVEALPQSEREVNLDLLLAQACLNLSRSSPRRRPLLQKALGVLDGVREEGERESLWWKVRGEVLAGLGRRKEARLCQARGDLLPQPSGQGEFPEREAGGTDGPGQDRDALLEHIRRRFPGRQSILTLEEGMEDGSTTRRYFVHAAPTPQTPWQTVITLGVGAKRQWVPPGLRVPARVELVLKFPPEMDINRGTYPLYGIACSFAHQYRNLGGWLAPGILVRISSSECAFVGCLFQPLEGWPQGAERCCLPDGEEVVFLEFFFLWAEEVAFCLDEGRKAELVRRLRTLPAAADPHRPGLCPEALPHAQEEVLLDRLRQLQDQKRHPEMLDLLDLIPPEADTLALRLARAEALALAAAGTRNRAYFRRALEVLEPLDIMMQADGRWLIMMGNALFRLGRREEALPYLERAWLQGAACVQDILCDCRVRCQRAEVYAQAEEAELEGILRSRVPGFLSRYPGELIEGMNASVCLFQAVPGRSCEMLVTLGAGYRPGGGESVELALLAPPAERIPGDSRREMLVQSARAQLTRTVLRGWGMGIPLSPGTWMELSEEGHFRGAMITDLPEELSVLKGVRLTSGREIAFRRFIPLLPEELELCRRGRAEELRRKLEKLPPGGDLTRDPAVPESRQAGRGLKTKKKRRR